MALFAYERGVIGEVRRGRSSAEQERRAIGCARCRSIHLGQEKGRWIARYGASDSIVHEAKILNKDLVIFTRQFATMIDSGLPLVQCLEIQAAQAPNPTLREQLAVVKESVESGVTFADGLKFPDTLMSCSETWCTGGWRYSRQF